MIPPSFTTYGNKTIARQLYNPPKFGVDSQRKPRISSADSDSDMVFDAENIDVKTPPPDRRVTRQSASDSIHVATGVPALNTPSDSFAYTAEPESISGMPRVKTAPKCNDPGNTVIKRLNRGQVLLAKRAFVDKGGDPADRVLLVEIYNETGGKLKNMAEFYAKKEARLLQEQAKAKKAEDEQRIITALQPDNSKNAYGLFRRFQTRRSLPLFQDREQNNPKDFQELWDVFVAKECKLDSMAQFREEKARDLRRKEDEQQVLALLDQKDVDQAKEKFLALTYGVQHFSEPDFEDLEFEHAKGGLTHMADFYKRKIVDDMKYVNYSGAHMAFKALAGKAYSPINWLRLREEFNPNKNFSVSAYLHTPLNTFEY